jgi:hypothetical protein
MRLSMKDFGDASLKIRPKALATSRQIVARDVFRN